jgi:hypothetical protein
VKKQNCKRRVQGSETAADERNSWIYAFLILLATSAIMLALRITGRQFLVPEFEIALIYFPTVLSAIIAGYVSLKSPR